jgi:hypothetical protein
MFGGPQQPAFLNTIVGLTGIQHSPDLNGGSPNCVSMTPLVSMFRNQVIYLHIFFRLPDHELEGFGPPVLCSHRLPQSQRVQKKLGNAYSASGTASLRALSYPCFTQLSS